jgi:hypothetical protein
MSSPGESATWNLDRLRVHRWRVRADAWTRSRGRPLLRRRRDHERREGVEERRGPRLRRRFCHRRRRAARRRLRRLERQPPWHRTYPTGGGDEAVEFTVDPAKLHDVFAADLADELTPLIAATQRPLAELAFTEPSGAPAWKDLPSWAVVALSDKAAGTDLVRSMAERAGARVTEVEGSHVIMISQPDAVTGVIMEALAMVAAPAPVG